MAGKSVNNLSLVMCTMGSAPAALTVLDPKVLVSAGPAANIMDNVPLANIPTFGMCMSPANPVVAAATAAALGVLTPMPCIPVTMPWTPGVPTVLLRNFPALDENACCMCSWGGQVSVSFSASFSVDVG